MKPQPERKLHMIGTCKRQDSLINYIPNGMKLATPEGKKPKLYTLPEKFECEILGDQTDTCPHLADCEIRAKYEELLKTE